MKKIAIIVGIVFVIVIGSVAFVAYTRFQAPDFDDTAATTTPTALQQMEALPPLPAADEATLQKQLQDIVAGGKESECASLSDARYQYACHDFFKQKK